jgi:hypothetical protein
MLEDHAEPHEGSAGGERLALPPGGEAALEIWAHTMLFGITVA